MEKLLLKEKDKLLNADLYKNNKDIENDDLKIESLNKRKFKRAFLIMMTRYSSK